MSLKPRFFILASYLMASVVYSRIITVNIDFLYFHGRAYFLTPRQAHIYKARLADYTKLFYTIRPTMVSKEATI